MANARNVVDINAIPTIALARVDIETGGASAVYGSDAISGVVNFRLRDQFQGFESSFNSGISQHGDGHQADVGAIAGDRFAGGRGHIMAAVDYSNRGLVTGADRCSFYCGGGLYSSYLASGSILTPFSGASPAAVAGLFNGKYGVVGSVPTLTNFGVNNNGTIFAAVGGANLDSQSRTYLVPKFGNSVNQATGPDNYIVQPQQRISIASNLSFEAAPSIIGYLRGFYTDSRVQTDVGYAVSGSSPLNPVFQGGVYGGNMVIPASNPFIPPDLAGLLASRPNPNAPIYYFKRFSDLGRRIYHERYRTWQAAGGLKRAKLGSGLDWEIYVAHGATDQREALPNAVLLSHLQTLLNAPDGGNAICAGGYNPFGSDNVVSSACHSYLTTDAESTQTMRQDLAEAGLSGVLSTLPAGDARFSLSASWRRESYSASPDCNNRASADADCIGIDPANIAASVAQYTVASVAENTEELSAEFLLPIVRNTIFAKAFTVNLGARWSRYSRYGSHWTWRSDIIWQPLTSLVLRGGYERALRIPSFAEAAIPVTGNVASLTITDPCSLTSPATRANPAISALCLAQMNSAAYNSYIQTSPSVNAPLQGNSQLRPERAETFTLGSVFTPDLTSPVLHHLSLSVDYYSIQIANAIGLYPLAQSALTDCFDLDPAKSNPNYSPINAFCRLITRNGTGAISSVVEPYANLGQIHTSGVDFSLHFEFSIKPDVHFFGMDANFSRLITYSVQTLPGNSPQKFAGTLGAGLLYLPSSSGSTAPQPRWRGLTSVYYQDPAINISLRWRYISGMADPNAIPNYSPSFTPSYSVFDLTTEIMLNQGLSMRLGVNNLFDRPPPEVTFSGMTLPSVYDVVGRYFYLTARGKF